MILKNRDYILIMESLQDSILKSKAELDFGKVQKLQQLQDRLSEEQKPEIKATKSVATIKNKTKYISSSAPPNYDACGEVYGDD